MANPVSLAQELLFEGLREAVIILDDQGFIQNMNPAALNLLPGCLPFKPGLPIQKILPGISLPPLTGEQELASFSLEAVCQPSQPGRLLVGVLQPVPRPEGGLAGWVLHLRSQANPAQPGQPQNEFENLATTVYAPPGEATLRHFSLAVEQSTITIIITDLEGRIEYVNPQFSRLTGYTCEEAIGQNPKILKSGETTSEEYRRLWETITSGGVWRGEFHNRKKDGTLYWESAVISPLTDEKGTITHFMAVKEEITARKQTEQELKHLNEDLEARVKARTLALTRRAQEMEAVARVSSALRRARTVDEMLPILITETAQILKARNGAILLAKDGELEISSLYNLPPFLLGRRHSPDSSPFWQAVKKCDTLQIANEDIPLEHLPAWGSDSQDILVVHGLRAMEQCLGIMVLLFEHHHPFTTESQSLLNSVIDIASNALYRANLMETLEQHVTTRTQELTTLYRVASMIGREPDLKLVSLNVLGQILEAVRGNAGAIHLWDPQKEQLEGIAWQGLDPYNPDIMKEEALVRWVITHQETLLIQNSAEETRLEKEALRIEPYRAYVGVPIRGGKEILGVLSIFSRLSPFTNVETLALLASIADQLGIAVVNAALQSQAREAAIIQERQRLARELHDSVTQLLYSQLLFADAGSKHAHLGDLDQASHYLDRLSTTALQALKEMRLMIYELRPSLLENEGLLGALQYRLDTVEKRAGVTTRLVIDQSLRLSPKVEKQLYRIAQEALNNALKHASASEVVVTLKLEGKQVEMEIYDNGAGFEPQSIREGVGFSSMRERAAQLGGRLEILSQPGLGTQISVSGPWQMG